ncbi:MAG: copper resistance CopC/CopD family protein [Chloroflexota bacterium]
MFASANPDRALAHAVLLRSIPSSNQTLARAPQEVRLLFSEPIDIVFSGIRVLNAAGELVDNRDTHVDQSDDHQLVVSLPPGLPNGVYSVDWRSLSTIDVHPDTGRFPLFVGVAVSADATRNASPVQLSATPETTLGRWWFYLAASLFGGVLAAWRLVVGPVVAGERVEVRAALHLRVLRLVVLGGVLLVVGTLFTALAQAAAAAGVTPLAGFGQPLADLLLRGRFAAIWWPRIGLEVVSLLLVAFGGLEGLAAECALATLPGVLLTSSLTSHGAALGPLAGIGIGVDWLHIVGATTWVGGLIALLACLQPVSTADTSGHHAMWRRLLARFSRFALLASAMVVLSGVVQAVFEIGSWSALVGTGYGQLVLAKLGLFAGMLSLAGFNTWHGRSRFRDAGELTASGPRVLRQSVWAELALGAVVLAVAAVLTGTPPTRGAP